MNTHRDAFATPDWDGFRRVLRREGTPPRVFCFEHGVAENVQAAIAARFGLWDTLAATGATTEWDRAAHVHAFLGHDTFRVFPPGARLVAPKQEGGWTQESAGAITSWKDFESFDWPRPEHADLSVLEYYEKHLPRNQRVFHVVDIWEVVRDSFGFETFCIKLFEEPRLVEAMFERVGSFVAAIAEACCDFECYGAVYLGDDLGYKTALMVSPEVIRKVIMPWHRRIAQIAHAHGKLFLFHSCGNMYSLIDDYIDDVRIDAKHSFEDNVLPVTEAKTRWGDRLSLLGGMDVDFLARAAPEAVRKRTREVLNICQPGGGYCLGSGNWVTHYIPLDNYLAMMDEARRWQE
jgi:uroporphyrinogen decarboxylase